MRVCVCVKFLDMVKFDRSRPRGQLTVMEAGSLTLRPPAWTLTAICLVTLTTRDADENVCSYNWESVVRGERGMLLLLLFHCSVAFVVNFFDCYILFFYESLIAVTSAVNIVVVVVVLSFDKFGCFNFCFIY